MTDDDTLPVPVDRPPSTRVVESNGREFVIDDWQDGKPPANISPNEEYPVIGHVSPDGQKSISVHGPHLGAAHQIRQEWRSHAAMLNSTGDPDDILEAYKIFCLSDYQFEHNVTLGFMEHAQAEVALNLYLDLDDTSRGIKAKTIAPRVMDGRGRGRGKDADRLPAARRVAHASIAAAVAWRRALFHRTDSDFKNAASAFYNEDAPPLLPRFRWEKLFSPKAKTTLRATLLETYLIGEFTQLAAMYSADVGRPIDDPLSGKGVSMGWFRGSLVELQRTFEKGPFVRERYYRDHFLPRMSRRIIRGAAY